MLLPCLLIVSQKSTFTVHFPSLLPSCSGEMNSVKLQTKIPIN